MLSSTTLVAVQDFARRSRYLSVSSAAVYDDLEVPSQLQMPASDTTAAEARTGAGARSANLYSREVGSIIHQNVGDSILI